MRIFRIEADMQINGVDYHVITAGDGPVLLLLHGFTGSGLSWQPHIQAFSQYLRVVAVDLLGHGRSSAPTSAERYRMEHVAYDLATLIERIGGGPVHLLGYSMGGRLALYFVAHYPNPVSRLILESASPGLPTDAERQKRREADNLLAQRVETEGIEKFVDYWEGLSLFASQSNLPQHVQKQQRVQRLQNNPIGLSGSLRGMGTGVQPSLWSNLASIQIPTQLIAGELDTKFVTIAQKMQSKIPDCHLNIVAGAGHAVHLEKPHLFEATVLNFVLA